MKLVENKLTIDEKNRNKHGPMHLFKYTQKNLGMYVFILPSEPNAVLSKSEK